MAQLLRKNFRFVSIRTREQNLLNSAHEQLTLTNPAQHQI